jgi:hypothetical protein
MTNRLTMDASDNELEAGLVAARAMLAALHVIERMQASGILTGDGRHDTTTQLRAAIALAETAGIK